VKSNYFIVEKDDAWNIPIVGRRVSRIEVDTTIKVLFFDPDITGDEHVEILIESPFHLEIDKDNYELHRVANPTGLGPIFAVIGKAVDSAVAFKKGGLQIIFENQIKLKIAPLEDYESWSIVGARGLRIVCMPGGELAVWQ
jgi:Family of unknown function (DUF6188)